MLFALVRHTIRIAFSASFAKARENPIVNSIGLCFNSTIETIEVADGICDGYRHFYPPFVV
jgi:hypothetical protein